MLTVIHKNSSGEIEMGLCSDKDDVQTYVYYHNLEPHEHAVLDVVKIHKDFFNKTW